ncbi:hypothetical protein JOE63_001814 [Cellulosimicrobium cellulans]|uniref:hypothetical protein n=1 Tax=Cellulosimicrobium cellulans TaxID=1710 RepID=UPI001958A3B4|nr:hypothetical protein [Cellulosimicrobium cellulans]MBM7819337.1 hypothetical protein [Cellulosimicrobium cellulans]
MNPASHLNARTTPARPRAARWLLAAGAALVAALAPVLPAAATASVAPGGLAFDTEDTITWSVTPADADGADGRRWVDFTADPGQTVEDHLAVTNFGKVPATFALKSADGYLTANGRFNMLPSDQESTDAGTWFTVQDTVEVGPDETVVVPYTITVPENATPGDHPAGIAASITSTGTDAGGTSLGVESRVGFRVTTRVTGEVEPVLVVENVKASYAPSWNPFAAGDLTVSYDVANDGNVRLGAEGDVATSALFGAVSADGAAEPINEVLPGGSLRSRVDFDDVWPLGPVRTTITVTPTTVADDQVDAPLEPVTVTVTTWAVPWPQLLLIAIVVVLIVGVRDDRRRRRQRLEAMLAKARDEGRQQAAGSEPAPSGTASPAAKGEPKA